MIDPNGAETHRFHSSHSDLPSGKNGELKILLNQTKPLWCNRVARLHTAYACATMVLFLRGVAPAAAEPWQVPPPLQEQVGQRAETQEKSPPESPTTSDAPRRRQGRRPQQRNGDPMRQELTLTGNLLGGYDDNVGAQLGSGAGSVPVAATSGSSGFSDVMLEYFRGTNKRSILIRSLGNLTMYPDYLDHAVPGAKARFVGVTPLGQKDSLRVSTQVRYESLFTPFVDAGSEAGVSDVTNSASSVTGVGVPIGLFERPSWVTSSKVYLTRNWSRRDTTVVAYNYFTQRYTDGNGNNDFHHAAGEYRRTMSRSVDLRVGYQYLNGRSTDYGGVTRPFIHQTVEGGTNYSKRLGGQRQLSVSVGAGATYVEAVDAATDEPYANWSPQVSSGATLGLTSTWSLSGTYTRGYSVLQGLTGQLYSTDSIDVALTGRLTSRADVVMDGTFANGRTLLASGAETFDRYGAALHIRVAMTSAVTATASYFNYYQHYSDPTALPTGFPAQYQRNAVVIGLSFWLRLAGRHPPKPRAPTDW
jgi:hypothetical protein